MLLDLLAAAVGEESARFGLGGVAARARGQILAPFRKAFSLERLPILARRRCAPRGEQKQGERGRRPNTSQLHGNLRAAAGTRSIAVSPHGAQANWRRPLATA